MSDKGKIIAGLVIFLVLATFPIWYLGIAGGSVSRPELEPPAGALLFRASWSAVQGGSDMGIDWSRLRGEFNKNRIALTGEASLTRDEKDGKWRVTDQGNRYLVLKDQDAVQVYTGCVEDRIYMIKNHMNILKVWREEVVRDSDRSRIDVNGRKYLKSLTKCCMDCHTSREKFCYECHAYANVLSMLPLQESKDTQQTQRGVRCWNCHVEPKG